ncbi:MAG: hypothetical protein LBI88_02850 [Deltaproteobacteria bacterium]|jgi:hypothetical protein|nr:hypothetical protein [Deltaproteobacteria bacterium]
MYLDHFSLDRKNALTYLSSRLKKERQEALSMRAHTHHSIPEAVIGGFCPVQWWWRDSLRAAMMYA